MSQNVLDALKAAHGAAIELVESQHGDEIAWIKRDNLVAVATWLRDDPWMLFDAPVFVTCIDRLDWRPLGVPPMGGTLPASPVGGAKPLGSTHWSDESGRPRFEVCFQLRSQKYRYRLRLKVGVPEHDARCPSLATLWPAFDWQERETFDMYGIRFEGHPDLRRIYMYEEFVGYPLRKDYPKEKRQPLVRRDDLPINPIKAHKPETETR
jgi:NADH-quinone oxidoreductase subunit C